VIHLCLNQHVDRPYSKGLSCGDQRCEWQRCCGNLGRMLQLQRCDYHHDPSLHVDRACCQRLWCVGQQYGDQCGGSQGHKQWLQHFCYHHDHYLQVDWLCWRSYCHEDQRWLSDGTRPCGEHARPWPRDGLVGFRRAEWLLEIIP
jgi:hypothetical protein